MPQEFRNFVTTQPTLAQTNPADTTGLAGIGETIKALAVTGDYLYKQKEKSALVGDKVGVTELPYQDNVNFPVAERGDLQKNIIADKLDTLNKIKTAREQGLISAARADLQVSKILQNASSGYPGMDDVLKNEAAKFFGKWGPGDNLLTPTSSEDNAQKIMDKFVTKGVEAGIINPYDPYNDKEGQARFWTIQRNHTMAAYNLETNQLLASNGKVDAATLANNFQTAVSSPAVASMLGNMSMQLAKGEKFNDPNVISNQISAVENSMVNQLNTRLRSIPGVSDADIKPQLEAIHAQFAPLKDMAKNGSLQTYLTTKVDLLKKAGEMDMIGQFPELVAMDTTLPHSVDALLKMTDQWSRMTPSQKELAMAGYPAWTRNFLSQGLGGHLAVPMMQHIIGNFQSGKPDPDHTSNFMTGVVALNAAKDGDPTSPDDKKSINNAAVKWVVSNMTTEKGDQYIIQNPKVITRIKNDPTALNEMKNRMTSHEVNVTTVQMPSQLMQEHGFIEGGTPFIDPKTNIPIGTLDYDQSKKEFHIKFTKEQEAKFADLKTKGAQGQSQEQRIQIQRDNATPDFVKSLNSLDKLIDVFGSSTGYNPTKWRSDMIQSFDNSIQAVIKQREEELANKVEATSSAGPQRTK